jgi:hypothetical protein
MPSPSPRPLYHPQNATPYALARVFYEHATEAQKATFRALMAPPRSPDAWSHVAWAVRHAGFVPTPARSHSELDGGWLVENLSDSDLARLYVSAWDQSNNHDLSVLSVEFSLRGLALPKVCA